MNSQATIKQNCEHLAAFEDIKKPSRITTIYSKRTQKDKLSMFNVITYKSNTGQYFCQCFSLLLGNDLKLIPPPLFQRKKPLDASLYNFFFIVLVFFLSKTQNQILAPPNKKTFYALAIEKAAKALFEWFENNLLKNNADKCHLSVSSSDAVS